MTELQGVTETDQILDLDNFEWIPSAQAIREIIQQFKIDGFEYSIEDRALIQSILNRLYIDFLKSRCQVFRLKHPSQKDDSGCYDIYGEGCLISKEFWQNWQIAELKQDQGEPNVFCSANWTNGDFDFRMFDEVGEEIRGFAFGVHFELSGMPNLGGLPKPPQQVRMADAQNDPAEKVTSPLGSVVIQPIRSKPPLSEVVLQSWWNNLATEVKAQSIDRILVPLCQAAFPGHTIARGRIRALDQGRTRGRKPISGKPTA
jgi:hypothetical protein